MMKNLCTAIMLLAVYVCSCNTKQKEEDMSASINRVFDNYWEDRMKLYPLEATTNGDNRYNNILQNDVSVAFINEAKKFYTRYQDSVKTFNPESLDENDRISYDIFKREM